MDIKQKALEQLSEELVKLVVDYAKDGSSVASKKVLEKLTPFWKFVPPRVAMKLVKERMDDLAFGIIKRLRCAANTVIWDTIRAHLGGKDCTFWESSFGKKIHRNEGIGLLVWTLAESVSMIHFDEAAKRHVGDH